jgi:hypothetical protein
MVLGIQIVGLFFGLFMIYYSFLHFKRNEFTIKEFSLWIILWIGLMIVALFPEVLDGIVARLSLSRTMDFLIIGGFMLLTSMFFYTYTLLRINQKKLEELVRKIALHKKK